MLTETDLIRKLDFFRPLDQKIIAKIAKACIVKEFAVGDYIVRQGEAGLGLYFITRGQANVEINRNGTARRRSIHPQPAATRNRF